MSYLGYNMSRKLMERKTRQQFIVDAAAKLFAQKGIENTSMDDIAKAVDYTRSTLYRYFNSFDEICVLVLVSQDRKRWELQKQAISGASNGADKLRTWGMSLFDFVQSNPETIRIDYFRDFNGIDRTKIDDQIFEEFLVLNNEFVEGLKTIFKLGMKDGSLSPTLNIDMCISQFVHSLRAILYRANSDHFSFTQIKTKEYVTHFLDLFLQGLRQQ